MKRSQLLSLALSCAATLSLAAGLRAEAPGGSHVPPSIAAKKESPEIVAALKPMRDQLAADRKAYQAAMKSGDQAGINAAKAAMQADYQAIRQKRMDLIKAGTK